MRIGALHSRAVHVADPDHTFEHAALATLGYLNDTESGCAAGCGMWAPTQGIGPSQRDKDPIGSDISVAGIIFVSLYRYPDTADRA